MLQQKLQQKLLQKLSPQQILLMKLLQIPSMALEQRIKQEIEDNPALEDAREGEDGFDEMENQMGEDAHDLDNNPEDATSDYDDRQDEFDLSDYISDDDDIPAYKTSISNASPDDEYRDIPYAAGTSFQEILLSQLGLRDVTEREKIIGIQIIGNLDDYGYLRRDLDAMADDLLFTQNIEAKPEEILRVLKIIQQFDPPGVGARNLQECLLIQLERKDEQTPSIKLAIHILERYFNEFAKKHYEKIVKRLGINEEMLKEAIDEIIQLDPKPGNSQSDTSRTNFPIIPDFIITNLNGELELSLNSRTIPDLRINQGYQRMLESYAGQKSKNSTQHKETLMFIKQKIDSAKWFIDAIRQRQDTLLYTMTAIMDYQQEYFRTGDETKLRPMILKDIASIVQLDISTISRVANSKYVQTPFGTFLLKSFFSESMQMDSGEEVSTREIKKILHDTIGAEDKGKPLTDDQLTQLLKEKGYNIARRTVAKYREQLGIPVARLRKEL